MESCGVCVVVLPFLGHGHFNAFLELSRMFSISGTISVIYVSLQSNLEVLKPRFDGVNLPVPVHFQELHIQNPPLPPGQQNLNRVPRSYLPQIFALIDAMRNPFETLMEAITGDRSFHESRHLPVPGKVVLVYDIFMGWSVDAAVKFNVAAYNFVPMSAHFWLCLKAMFWSEEAELHPPFMEVLDAVNRLSLPDIVMTALRRHMDFTKRAAGVIINTFREMEPKFVEASAPALAVGPVVGILPNTNRDQEASVIQWLDRQQPGSVIYVSFGTESDMSLPQVRELAAGLEAAAQPFVWVLRPPAWTLERNVKEDDWKADLLPDGFERRLNGRCLIFTEWAPQRAILGHRATCGFISHCGWNSTLESMAAGVPMIAMPVQSDQPANALLLTQVTRVALGLVANDEGIIKADEVATGVRRLVAGEEGAEIRRRVAEVRDALGRALAEKEGAAWTNIRTFIQANAVK